MPHPLTLSASLESRHRLSLPVVAYVRACHPSDAEELGEVYHDAYEPGMASTSVEQAVADVRASFDGEYGELWLEASPVAEVDGRIAAAVMTVRRAPWGDVPDSPFVIEVFTAREQRRRGLARHLLLRSMEILREAGESDVALRVMSNNHPALHLYGSLGFKPWAGHPDR